MKDRAVAATRHLVVDRDDLALYEVTYREVTFLATVAHVNEQGQRGWRLEITPPPYAVISPTGGEISRQGQPEEGGPPIEWLFGPINRLDPTREAALQEAERMIAEHIDAHPNPET